MATVELKESEWKKFSEAEYAVTDCYGDNCYGCILLEPVFDAVSNELNGISFGRINITQYPEIADTYKIDAMPTVLFFRRGEVVHQFIGSMDREELLLQLSKMLYE